MDQWKRFAHWYSLDQGGFEDDVDFYLSLAQRTGSPILELGCGTGRLVLALARAGYSVTGVDNLPAMLEQAQCQVHAAGPAVASRVRLLPGDMRQVALGERFALAILAVNTLLHLDQPEDQKRALQCAFAHLAPGGLLALDLFHPHPTALAPAEGELYLEKNLTDPQTGQQALKFVARRVDYARQVITATFIYDEMDPCGQVTRTAASFPLRYLHRPEAEQLLQAAGFIVEGVYGSYELDPYEDAGDRMLFLVRRPE
jgi:SAM-dependent methyltransferase